MNRLRLSLCLALPLVTLTLARAQEGLPARVNGGNTIGITAPARAAAKRPLKHYDYALWQSIALPQLTRDGKWAVYSIGPVEGDGVLCVRNTATGAEQKIPRGRAPQLTSDSRYVVFTIAPAFADSEKARKDKKPALPSALGILDLNTGKVETIERVRRFSLPAEGSRTLAYQLERAPGSPTGAPGSGTPTPPPADQQPPVRGAGRQRPGGARPGGASQGATPAAAGAPVGADLYLKNLGTGESVTLPDVTEFIWNKSGSRLAVVVDSKDDTKDGVFVWESGKTSPAATGSASWSGVTWDSAGEQLAFLRAPKPATPAPGAAATATPETPRAVTLWLWKGGEASATELVTEKTPGIPTGWQLSESGLRFQKDGKRLVLNVAPRPAPRPKDPPETINVDIWSSRDSLLQTMQKLRAPGEARRAYPALLTLKTRKLLVLSGPDQPTVTVDDEAKRWVVARDDRPYQQLVSWDQSYNDVYLLDLETGAKKRVLTRQGGPVSLSPQEKYLFWWDEAKRQWLAQPVEGGSPVVLGAAAGVSFWREEDDHPAPPPPHGTAGWTEGDRAILLYDKYDLWEVNPQSGAARPLTTGRKGGLIFRLQRTGLDPENPNLPTDKPVLLSVTDERSKAEGIWQMPSLREGHARKLVMEDAALGAPVKARDAETVLFTRERFDVFPDLWLAPSPSRLAEATRITDANPQQKDFVWGKSELVTYTSTDGQKLQAVLTVPDDFDPNKKYPMLVYIYERMADQLHRYVRPNVGTSINVSRYVSNGYIVLRPDISYRSGYPGESALKCVLPAVQEITRRGFIDEQRIGIQGHSWGAYQIAYLITRTNLFRAVEAGAAVSDMVSAYGGIRYGTGMSRAFQYERDQSRIGGTPWTDPLKYLENSPIFWADKVQTPYLTIHNDADGAVPWTQGIEFFTALRRLGKEAYLFNYNGEDHNLISRENMKHWTVHMAEFFDHYLLGAPRPTWMDQGVPYTERGTRDLRPYYTRPEEKKL